MGLLVEMPEGVYEAAVDEVSDPFPLHGQKARGVLVLHRVVDVYGLVADVVIPADHQLGHLLFQFIDVVLELVHVPQLEIEAVVVGPRGQVEAHYGEVVKVQPQVAALDVHALDVGAVDHVSGLVLGEHRHPAVSLLLGGEPELVVIAGLPEHLVLELLLVGLGLLYAEHVGVGCLQPVHEALFQGRPDSVHVV